MKLKAGDKFTVYGWVMLSGVEPGEYVVVKTRQVYGRDVYDFRKKRGHKIISHYSDNVDLWIKEKLIDLNGIVKHE